MDLRFDGTRGQTPDEDSLEYMLLQACSVEDRKLWRELKKARYLELERAINRLRRLGWGFEWITWQ